MKIQKPILKHQRPIARIKKSFIKRNDNIPGYIYIFYDRSAKLCKIGLSRNPQRRRYYLSQEYCSQLETVAIAPVFNMTWGEKLLHDNYQTTRQSRHPSLNGYTEWFSMSSVIERMELKVALWLAATFVNGCYLLAAIVLIGLVISFVMVVL